MRRRKVLLADQPELLRTFALRDVYIDPLSLLQVDLLARWRSTSEGDPARPAIERALGTTLNGVAQGLRNTA